MVRRLSLTYCVVSPENNQRIDNFSEITGDSLKTLVTQYVRGWISRNRETYTNLARLDAKRRNMSFPDWANIVAEDGMHRLPPVQVPLAQIDFVNPLGSVLRPECGAVKRHLNYISLATQNLVLFRVANFYDQDSTIGFISRIIQEHLDRNWDKLYLPQIVAENFDNWE